MGGYNTKIALVIFERYMNATTPRGYFRQPGSIHLHIDGGVQYEPVRQTLSTYGGKLQKVLQAIAGPQRRQLPHVYRGHTPGSLEQENFEFFSTTPIASQSQAVEIINTIYPRLYPYSGIIIELERIVLEGRNGQWNEVPPLGIQDKLSDIPFQQAYSLQIEIHHGINIPKRKEKVPPLALSSLLSLSHDAGLCVGGWFLFEKEGMWAFRSNEFTESDVYRQLAQNQHQALHEALQKLDLEYELWTIAEQVLGLWRIEKQV